MNLCEQLNIEISEAKLDSKYTSNDNAMSMIRDEITQMEFEVEQSEAGKRTGKQMLNDKDGEGYLKYVNLSTKSTFPLYLQDIFNGSGTKKKFLSATKKGKGIVWNRIALVAIERLEHGYKNQHGYDVPNDNFIAEVEDPTPF